MDDIESDRRRVLASLALTTAFGGSAKQKTADHSVASGTSSMPRVAVEAFGATGNGEDDDTAAFQRALDTVVPGTTIDLAPGRSYKLTRSLRFTKPLIVRGGTKEDTKLLFGRGSYEALGGQRAAALFPHSSSTIPQGKGAQRSVLSGFSMHWTGDRQEYLHGVLICSPVYFNEIDVHGFTGDGFRIEAGTERLKGNANGSSLTNCASLFNGGHGFSLHGNNANACLLLGTRAFDNRGAGFFDNSLLGNTYVSAEVDNNKGGGYTSNPDLPNNSVYVGCYAEPGQLYKLNMRNLVIGPLGHVDGLRSGLLRVLPSGELFTPAGYVVGGDASAAVNGAADDYLRLSPNGIDLAHRDGQRVRFRKLLSANYVDLLNNEHPVLRLPAKPIVGNVDSNRPVLPAGFTLGGSGRSGILGAGPRPPVEGTYAKGALWLNEEPAPGAVIGWVCIKSGEPGMWRGFGKIE